MLKCEGCGTLTIDTCSGCGNVPLCSSCTADGIECDACDSLVDGLDDDDDLDGLDDDDDDDDGLDPDADPNCRHCHGTGVIYEDVAGDGGSRMPTTCECITAGDYQHDDNDED